MRAPNPRSAGPALVALVLVACAGLGSGTVRGQVETPPIPLHTRLVVCIERQPGSCDPQVPVGADGAFALADVEPGSLDVVLYLESPNGLQELRRTRIDVPAFGTVVVPMSLQALPEPPSG